MWESSDSGWSRTRPCPPPSAGSSSPRPETAKPAFSSPRLIRPNQREAIGNQTGGRVFLILKTDDFDRDFARFKQAGIEFLEEPRKEAYGKVVVFRDAFGNKWDLIEPLANQAL